MAHKVINPPSIVTDMTGVSDYEKGDVGIRVTHWWRQNLKKLEGLAYQHSAGDQLVFVRDVVGNGLQFDLVDVISTHVSKSCELLVYYLRYQNLEIILRNNFYNWIVTVNTPFDVEIPKSLMTFSKEKLSSCYCEGFKDEWILDSYTNNPRSFTVQVWDSEYKLYTMIYLILEQYKNTITKQ